MFLRRLNVANNDCCICLRIVGVATGSAIGTIFGGGGIGGGMMRIGGGWLMGVVAWLSGIGVGPVSVSSFGLIIACVVGLVGATRSNPW